MQAARKRVLRGKSVVGRKDSSLQLSGMSLHLVLVLVDAAKEKGTAMDVEHTALAFSAALLSCIVVLAHLDPLGFERDLWVAPFPPGRTSDLLDSVGPKLSLEVLGRSFDGRGGYVNDFGADPSGAGDPLGGEGLEVVDGLGCGVGQELADQVETNIVGDMSGRSPSTGFSIKVLGPVRLSHVKC